MHDFNFFEPYLYSVNKEGPKRILSILLIVVLIGGLGGFYYYNTIRMSSIQNNLDQLNVEILGYQEKGVLERKNILQEEKAALEAKILAAGTFEASNQLNYQITDELISDVVGLIPRDLYLDNASIADNSISMSGFAYDRAVVAEYEFALRNSGNYENMFVSVIFETDEAETERFTFNLTFNIKAVN
jgi:Tfp pilus assembly protein PilN